VLVDLGQQFGLGAAGAGCVPFRRCHGDVLEVHLGGEDAAGPVGEFHRQRPAQGSQAHRVVRDGFQPEPLAGGPVHPVPEPCVADGECDAAEEERAGGGIVVELRGEPCCLVDGLDDDPFIAGAAERLALDELAGQPVAGHARQEFLGRLPAVGMELHQLAGPHAGDGGDYGSGGGPDDAGQGDGLGLVQGRGPGRLALAVSAVDKSPVAGEYFLDADGGEGFLDGVPQFVQPPVAEPVDAGLAGQHVQAGREQGVIGPPSR
jgi:hypothetical protein